MKRLIAFVAFILLTGCTTVDVPAYQEPERTTINQKAFDKQFDDYACSHSNMYRRDTKGHCVIDISNKKSKMKDI